MLVNTFQHIKGISANKERALWIKGITTWDALDSLFPQQLLMFSPNNIYNQTSESRRAFLSGDAEFFARSLDRSEYYRIALSFPEQTLFLDIETTGLSRYYDSITLVGWSKGTKYDVYVKGDSDKSLRKALSEAKAIVTFNGSLFDLPFLKKEFPEIAIPPAHIDLRFFAKRVGFSGGQKLIEQEIGIQRESGLEDLDGEAAPVLWHKYKRGELHALKLLISYNHADVEGLKYIFDATIKRLIQKCDIPSTIPIPHYFSSLPSSILWSNNNSALKEGIRLVPYKGKKGPTIRFNKLPLKMSPVKVVGIDLTGSELRPSGWCLLNGNQAYTKRIETDQELIEETINANPHLVSIDSPLSIPKGRIVVTDDDPGRFEYGIMRSCERALKKRGVNVYPSLIKSMQGLTARGMRLASMLRKLGLPVIESYPGAAQDIMNIPRKRAGLEFLKIGLSEFGVKGKYIKNLVSHDELDAITSAIVGVFFLSGKFEALGNEEEDYLIIPNVEQGQNIWTGRKVIGLSGYIASGKTTAGRFLEKRGYAYARYSLVLKSMLETQGIQVDRNTLQVIGEEVYENPGQRWLCQQLLKRLPSEGNIVIDGLRHPEDHAFWVETFGPDFLHIYIDAPSQIRRHRYICDGGSPEEFNAVSKHPVEAHIPLLASLAHHSISNAETERNFQKAVLKLVDAKN
jgi:uncharacterized protein YprB with RNaseH-like and TPR domain/predicted nuclease with RNAse H fold/dephospho-CoA kinase